MHLKYRGILGLVLGLALLLFNSCEEPGRIGIDDVDPDALAFKTTYSSFILPAKLIQVDSLITSNAGALMVGKDQDPYFGEVVAKSYTQLWLSNTPNFSEDAVYDSMVLQLPFFNVSGTDIRSLNDIKIYRLEEDLDVFRAYYNFSELTVSDQIGETSFVYFTENIDEDEVVKLDTMIRINMSNDLGIEFFDKIKDEDDTIFSSNANFLDYFKGISIESGDRYSSITGFDQDNDDAIIVLFYHVFDTEGEPVASSYIFNIKNSTHFNNIKYDRTGTPIEGTEEPYIEHSASDEYLYCQSGTGLGIKFDFQPLLDYADSVGPMIINLAILTLGSVDEFPQYLQPPSSVIYYYTDSTNRRVFDDAGFPRTIQQDNPNVDAAGAQFALNAKFKIDEEEYPKSYSDGVSNTLQAMIEGRIDKQHVVAVPLPTINAVSVSRFRLNPQNIKLEIYFTTSNTISNSEN